uniref:Secreted protein n=1 Tax=Elaeophora elaphi TaxID=1147741 RepID=A0A0R3RNA5_9BILA
MRLLLIACVGLIILSPPIASAQETSAEPAGVNVVQDDQSSSPVCHANEIFDGKTCKCAPGIIAIRLAQCLYHLASA